MVTHNIRVRLGYAATFTAMNMDTWNDLGADTQNLILAEAKKMEDAVWAFEQSLDQKGMDCNASGPCDKGEPGGMVPVEPTAADQAKLKGIVQDFVLKRWAKRCGADCAKEWNETVGNVVGVKAPM